MVKRALAALAAAAALSAAYLAYWPVPLDPAAWTPPEAPPFPADARRPPVARLGRGDAIGPEATAIDREGRLHTGTADGRILRLRPDGSFETLARTGGRPLGMAFDADGGLLVADHRRGLLRLAPAESGVVPEVLVTEADGVPLGFANDVAVGPDGVVYFTDASSRQTVYRTAFLEHRPTGRLLAWDPRVRRVQVLQAGLHFANGVAVGPDGDYLVVNETAEYRVSRYWLRGPKAGTLEPLVENLPGFPDNVTWSPSRGVFWVALFSPRVPALDATLPRPWLRKVVARLPRALQPEPPRRLLVLAVDPAGHIVDALEDGSEGAYAPVTSAREHDGWLWLGSLEEVSLGRVRLAGAPARAEAVAR
jgi:sugar lactone lactonase YvrE